MQDTATTRRRVLLGAGAAMAGLAGCAGSDTDGTATASADDTATESNGTAPADGDGQAGTPAATPAGPSPDCSQLTGQPTPYDAVDTPFICTFDYVDSWTVANPLEGPDGRSQGVTSPQVSVDGEPESAGIRVGQHYQPLTASQVDEEIDDAVSGEYSRVEVVRTLDYGGDAIRVVGFPDSQLGFYQFWLPYDGMYYRTEVDVLSSILELDEDNQAQLLCLEAIQTARETVLTSLRPNPDTTIDSI